jgi:hypothetical protein
MTRWLSHRNPSHQPTTSLRVFDRQEYERGAPARLPFLVRTHDQMALVHLLTRDAQSIGGIELP